MAKKTKTNKGGIMNRAFLIGRLHDMGIPTRPTDSDEELREALESHSNKGEAGCRPPRTKREP